MGKKTKDFIICVVGWVCFITFVFYIGTRCYLSINQSADYIKDSLSNSISFLSAVSTIGAAVIAAYLFSDWREQSQFEEKREIAKNLLISLLELKTHTNEAYVLALIANNPHTTRLSEDVCNERANKTIKHHEIYKEVFIKNYNLYCEVYLNEYGQLPNFKNESEKCNFFMFSNSIHGAIRKAYNKNNPLYGKTLMEVIEITKINFEQSSNQILEKIKPELNPLNEKN